MAAIHTPKRTGICTVPQQSPRLSGGTNLAQHTSPMKRRGSIPGAAACDSEGYTPPTRIYTISGMALRGRENACRKFEIRSFEQASSDSHLRLETRPTDHISAMVSRVGRRHPQYTNSSTHSGRGHLHAVCLFWVGGMPQRKGGTISICSKRCSK